MTSYNYDLSKHVFFFCLTCPKGIVLVYPKTLFCHRLLTPHAVPTHFLLFCETQRKYGRLHTLTEDVEGQKSNKMDTFIRKSIH